MVTSGVPRKPGMTREELIGINADIVENVIKKILTYSPNTILVIVSNPMDTMTYLTIKKSGLSKNKVIGMGGALDSSRFRTYISMAMNKPSSDIHGMVIGGHGDTTMIPLDRFASYNGINISEFLSKDKIEDIVSSTMVGGATLTKLLGTSAWYAPGASVSYVVDSIINDQKKIIPSSVYLEGEYNEKNICIGVPVIIGRDGVEKIIELDLSEDEKKLFKLSAEAIRKMNNTLK